MAITLVSTQKALKIYATPIEWLYEYKTVDNGQILKKIKQINNFIFYMLSLENMKIL